MATILKGGIVMPNRNSVNKVILVGRLGKDPDVRYTSNGDAVADMSLATSESFRKKGGEQTERTEWHNLVVWRKTAEFAKQYLKKGQLLYAEGKLQTRKWEDKEGQNHYKTEVQVGQLVPLGSFVGRAGDAEVPAEEQESETVEEDEIPF